MTSYLDFIMMCSNVIDIQRFNNMCTLPLCCSNDSQECDTDRDTDNTEQTQKKKTRKKTSISKHDISNFFKNIAFIILGTFQILVLIT